MSLRCAIDAPDAFAAFVLARELDPYGDRTEIEARDTGFRVAFDADEDELAQALRVVQHWLHEERIAQTLVRFGGRAQLLRAA